MKKIICLILCWTFTAAFAEIPSWHPENIPVIRDKCIEDTQLPYSMQLDMKMRNGPIDNPKVHEVFLCMAKGTNVYSEDTGINVDRLAYSFFESKSKLNCRKRWVQDCVDNNKEAASDGEMIFKVITCIIAKEDEKMKKMASSLN